MSDDLIECRECGTRFALDAQFYYDNLCPSCVAADDPERTYPGCIVCDEKIHPDDLAYKTVGPSAPGQRAERVPVHEDCK